MRAVALKRKTPPKPGFKVEITDIETNLLAVYDSVRKAAIAIGSDIKTMMRREKSHLDKGKKIHPIKENIQLL